MSAAVVAAAAVAGTLGRGRRPDTAQVAHGHIFAGRRREKTWRQVTVVGSSCDEGIGNGRKNKCECRLGLAVRASTSYRTARVDERGRVALRGYNNGLRVLKMTLSPTE